MFVEAIITATLLLPAQPVSQATHSVSQPSVKRPVGLNAKHLTKRQTRRIVTDAGKAYGLTRSERVWLRGAAVDIIYDGAAESHGSAAARLGQHVGILQFNRAWRQSDRDRRRAKREGHKHPGGDWRACARCSLYRFVRVYRDGGRSAIERHWKATIYR